MITLCVDRVAVVRCSGARVFLTPSHVNERFTASIVARSLLAAERSCCVTGCWVSRWQAYTVRRFRAYLWQGLTPAPEREYPTPVWDSWPHLGRRDALAALPTAGDLCGLAGRHLPTEPDPFRTFKAVPLKVLMPLLLD